MTPADRTLVFDVEGFTVEAVNALMQRIHARFTARGEFNHGRASLHGDDMNKLKQLYIEVWKTEIVEDDRAPLDKSTAEKIDPISLSGL